MARGWGNVLLLPLLWGLFANCSPSPSDSTSGAVEQDTMTSIGSTVTALNLTGSSSTIKINNPTADEDVVVVLFGTETATQDVELSLTATVNPKQNQLSFISSEDPDSHETDDVDLHDRLRAYEKTLSPEERIQQTAFQAQANAEASVGSHASFFVMSSLDDFDATSTVDAILLYQTEFFNFYVDSTATDNMSSDNVAELCENFADVIEDLHANFGYESDINGDGRFDILATPIVNQLGRDTSSITTGFWFAKDLYDVAGSNRREIFYTAVPDPQAQYGFLLSEDFAFSNILRSALPHEFQHMISYNERVLQLGVSGEDPWLNEALSHLAEDVYSTDADGYMLQTGIENPVRVGIYLDQIRETCFRCDVSLAARGGAYLFLRTLYEAAEQGEYSTVATGRELLQHLVKNSQQGELNVLKTLFGADAKFSDFKELLGQFVLTIYFAQNDLTLNGLPTLTGIDLNGYQDDNRSTHLHGVNVSTLEDVSYRSTLKGLSVTYIQITGEDLLASDGEVILNYEAGASLSGYLLTI